MQVSSFHLCSKFTFLSLWSVLFIFSVIFELVNQRQELWDKMLELENRANDPSRLFHNRGGQLLLEEKERKNIQKVIQ